LRLTIPRETGRYKGKRTIPIEEASMPDITHDTGRVNLEANHWMRSKVTLLENGHIDATTHTETDTDFGGFTGGVQLMYSDANQITIGGSDVHSFGMDGKWIGRNARRLLGRRRRSEPAPACRRLHDSSLLGSEYSAIGHVIKQATDDAKPSLDVLAELKKDGLIT
jgi:hypothetical protein